MCLTKVAELEPGFFGWRRNSIFLIPIKLLSSVVDLDPNWIPVSYYLSSIVNPDPYSDYGSESKQLKIGKNKKKRYRY